MTFGISELYKAILLIICGSLYLQTLSRLSALADHLSQLSKADTEFVACAQRKASLLNIDASYYYLKIIAPNSKDDLKTLKTILEEPLLEHEQTCTHRYFQNFQASARVQNTEKSEEFIPNWVLAVKETKP